MKPFVQKCILKIANLYLRVAFMMLRSINIYVRHKNEDELQFQAEDVGKRYTLKLSEPTTTKETENEKSPRNLNDHSDAHYFGMQINKSQTTGLYTTKT